MKKKIISLGLATATIFTLASCKETVVNTTVPYGKLSDTSIYASVGNNQGSISQKKLYDLMKKDGYSLMTEEIKKSLFNDITSDKKYFDYSKEEDRYQITSSLVNTIYGVSKYDAYKELKEKDKKVLVQKYVDNLFKENTKKSDGTYFTVSDIESIEITEVKYNGESKFEATFPKELYQNQIYDIAMTNYAREMIKNPESEYYYKNEYVKGEGKNNYYITDENIRDYYYSTYKNYKEYKGIVIKFASEAQAIAIMNSAIGSTTINSENAIEEYTKIYNYRYVTRPHLSTDSEEYLNDEYVDLSVSKNSNKLTTYSSNFEDFFLEMENGEFLTSYFNLDNAYYLVYRLQGDDVIEWENLDDKDKVQGDGSTIYDKVLDELIDSKNFTTIKTKIENERYEEIHEDNNLVIYDPVYSYLYDEAHDDYAINNNSSDDLIYKFTYNDKEYKLSVDDFYPILENKYGINKSINYLEEQYYLSLDKMVEKIDSSDVDDYRTTINNSVEDFKDGDTSYPKTIGVETYLQLNYGYNTVDEIVESYKADLVSNVALSYYGNHETTDNMFNMDSKLFANFEKTYKEIYDDFFSATISHILIGVDEDYSGSYSDPDIYRNNLISDELREQFDATIISIANAIIKEVKVLKTSNSVKDALDFIVTAYNNNYKIASLSYEEGRDITWYDLKNQFPITLKAEDLGVIDNSKASTYVKEFSVAAKNLYKAVIDGKIEEKDVEDKGVLELTEAIDSTDKLCKTVYGYHILNIYDIGEQESAKFVKDNDSKDDDRENYKTYEHLAIVVDPAEEDDEEDYIVYADSYSENEWASKNQLFIYFYENINGSSSSLKSSCKNAISTIFDGMISTYTSETFKEWRMIKQMNIKFESDKDGFIMDYYISNLEKSLFGYEPNEFTLYTDWVDSEVYDWTIDFSK